MIVLLCTPGGKVIARRDYPGDAPPLVLVWGTRTFVRARVPFNGYFEADVGEIVDPPPAGGDGQGAGVPAGPGPQPQPELEVAAVSGEGETD